MLRSGVDQIKCAVLPHIPLWYMINIGSYIGRDYVGNMSEQKYIRKYIGKQVSEGYINISIKLSKTPEKRSFETWFRFQKQAKLSEVVVLTQNWRYKTIVPDKGGITLYELPMERKFQAGVLPGTGSECDFVMSELGRGTRCQTCYACAVSYFQVQQQKRDNGLYEHQAELKSR